VRIELPKERLSPAQPTFNPEEIMLRANALFRAEQSQDLRAVIAEKIEELRHYDVLAMDRVAAILSWGRSGSLLLSSYLDGHEDVLMLPELGGEKLYSFFERYQSLPWSDKLLAYAAFEPNNPRFFEGNFAISSARYYAAVQAIIECYGKWTPEFLQPRRAFFLFVHIAYTLALGRRPASSHPLIVYAQHARNDEVARRFVEDFPRAKFIHTIRDPLSSCDANFHYFLGTVTKDFPRTYTLTPYWAIFYLTDKDRPHSGMESRTRTVRFEDLQRETAQTIHDLSDWLGLSYQATLLDSTFNGVPYVVKRDGQAWSGRRPEQAQRNLRYISPKDRALLFAFFYQNLVDWNYPCPKIFGYVIVRWIVFLSLVLFPMKMETVAARGVLKGWTLPLLRQGKIWGAIKSLLGMGFYRLKIIRLLVSVFFQRCVHRTTLLQVDHKTRPSERRDVHGSTVLPDSTTLITKSKP
jgi:Sulfotransferase family